MDIAIDDDYNPFTDEGWFEILLALLYNCVVFKTDLEKLLSIERSESHEDGWKMVKKGDLAEVWKHHDDDSSVHLIKVVIM